MSFNELSPTAQATLLLTSYFSKASYESVKPLSNKEWGKFALWLRDKSLSPKDLLGTNPESLLEGWADSKISVERIVYLLGRGHSLALAMEKWHRAGLWVVTRSDPEYPKRLKQHLKMDSPPVLFGCGDKNLLNAGGLAVVGSRNANPQDLSFTQHIGAKAASENVAIVSGGARGVDEAAMLGAAQQGGVVIGILADSLLRAATSSKWRSGLMNNHLVLVSPFYPEAGFFAGNAMARNKYIYCLADSALVIHSGKKGGTLSGAEENLKKGWVPLWVKTTADKSAANADLVAKGGKWLPQDIDTLPIRELFSSGKKEKIETKAEQVSLFGISNQADLFSESESELAMASKESSGVGTKANAPTAVIREPEVNEALSPDFYQVFLTAMKRCSKKEMTVLEIAEYMSLHKSQVGEWLKRATAEGAVKKLNKPVRYKLLRSYSTEEENE